MHFKIIYQILWKVKGFFKIYFIFLTKKKSRAILRKLLCRRRQKTVGRSERPRAAPVKNHSPIGRNPSREDPITSVNKKPETV